MELERNLLDSLNCENAHEYFYQLDKNEELEKIIPKVKEMKLVGECKYHVVNCFEHSLNALEEFESLIKDEHFFPSHLKDRIYEYLNTAIEEKITILQLLKLGVFLHDVGKPDAKTVDETGRVHFKGHEKVGEDIAKVVGTNLSLSKKSIDILSKYVRYHMILLVLYKTNDTSQSKLFELFEILGDDIIGIMLLGYADIVSTRKLLNPNENSGIIKTYMEYILMNYMYRYERK